MKTCSKCREIKPYRDFNKRSAKDGRRANCRACQSAYLKSYGAERRAELYAEVNAYKLEHGCMDCGYRNHAIALDLDHRPGEVKRYAVSWMVNRGFAREGIFAEIAKCDVVCANCHRVRTADRRKG